MPAALAFDDPPGGVEDLVAQGLGCLSICGNENLDSLIIADKGHFSLLLAVIKSMLPGCHE